MRRMNRKRWRSYAWVAGLALVAGLAGILDARQDAAAPAADSQGVYTLAGEVVRVADGDTFTLLSGKRQERVRLASIDAPETTHSREQPGQPFANASREALSDLIAGKKLSLRCFEQDRFERHICDVPLPDGGTANQRLVASGMAWANREGKGKFLRDPAIGGLERQARDQRLGLWRDRNPVAPWVWRYECWRQTRC